MPQFFLNKRLIILLVSIIVLVALIGFSLKEDRKLTWPEQFINDTTGLFQTMFHRPAQYVAGFFENVEDLKNTYDENKYLKSRLDEYAKLDSELQILAKENEQLREEVDRKESLRDYNPIYSTVIGRSPDQRWYELVKIDKGSQHGVEADMAVITSRGMVGRVKSVSSFVSTVQLLSAQDRKNRIAAIVEGDESIYGLIEGYDSERRMLMFRRLNSDMDIQEGQKVITSGKGGVFPEGLLIGEVKEVQPDSYGLTKMAFIEPSADFYDLENVIVVERTKDKVDVEAMFEEEEVE
ncbi:rod shape-determining protein MreC [Bacillus lacus]|uniref:Cell shape-determining protein MreC n=1 Tax=Metabacillus lacus TaxID=1983721 RepID=A0A7X2IXI2_9BACI|nr:rod shape-determining protein MreC [Metabacillus lacus]MRX71424.1 rod shape-determining protein MreC [Metabacillus lacus]